MDVANSNINPYTNAANETLSNSINAITLKYGSQLKTTSIDSDKNDIQQQSDVLKSYNQEIETLIKSNNQLIAKTTNSAEKDNLNAENKKLEEVKLANEKSIALNDDLMKQKEANQISANSNNNSNPVSLNTQTNNESQIVSSNVSATLISEAETLSSQAYDLRKEALTKTGAEKELLIKQAVEKENTSNDKKLEASIVIENKIKLCLIITQLT